MTTMRWIFIAALLGACASQNQAPDTDDSLAPAVEPSPPDGSLGFFRQGTAGMSIRAFRWADSVGSENPGIDCALKKLKRPEVPNSVYGCVLKSPVAESVVIHVFEGAGPNGKVLKRVTVDAKGRPSHDRWASQLLLSGYRLMIPVETRSGRQSFLSGDSGTVAQLIWVGDRNATTLSFTPGLPTGGQAVSKASNGPQASKASNGPKSSSKKLGR